MSTNSLNLSNILYKFEYDRVMRVSKEWMTWVGASAIDPLFETWLIMFEFSVHNLHCYVMIVFCNGDEVASLHK